MISANSVFFAFLGGILPAILWLWFWLKEDKDRPEPRPIIIGTFIAGMLSVFLALFLERGLGQFIASGTTLSIVLWAVIEEGAKFTAAYMAALRLKENDEPVDMMIYLITAALGFAALENAFFLLTPLGAHNIAEGLVTGNLRFIGSSLLHVTASGVIGIFGAYAFCELKNRKRFLLGIGFILAVALHAFFNFFILHSDNNLFIIFGFVWVAVVVLILFFERVKGIDRTCVVNS
jgi:RsiW-degrading membrane proteinase PrsW (M82 family)